jgi:NADPH:quinone reductase-like Zn-dependent oxidoreductase
VCGLKVGDRVAYAGPTGGYSEVRLIEADRLVRLLGRNRNRRENVENEGKF